MQLNIRVLRHTVLSSVCLLGALSGHANNIQVTNASLAGNNSISAFAFVQFDVTWENSWKGNGINNWDAAWIFAKYRTAGGAWQPVQFNNTGHTAPAGSQIDLGLLTPGTAFNATTNPVIGTYLLRSAEGTGTFSATGVQLRWNYGLQGLNYADIAEVRVYAIEMVYVPQGAFAAGSGGTETNAFTLTTINTANATTAPSGTGSLGGQAGGIPTGQTAPTNASWPNGFAAFYCMKYEVTQQGYVDFLNTLTYTQQVTRTASVPTSAAGSAALFTSNANRNGIDIQTPGVASTIPALYACNLDGDAVFGETVDGTDIACNFLSWGDLTAYLDWSGLRPMTELEFEKACRGTIISVANENPWGASGFTSGSFTLANAGAPDESIATNYSTVLANYCDANRCGSATNGPLRVGIFGANVGNSGRVTAGASYYGIMETGGNVSERSVTIGNASGRVYTGVHGNGGLDSNGDHDAATWPSAVSALGSGSKGGVWNNGSDRLRVSDRFSANSADPIRTSSSGGRGVRTTP